MEQISCYIFLIANACRTMTSGWHGAPYFGRHGRELVSEPAISLKNGWRGCRRTTRHKPGTYFSIIDSGVHLKERCVLTLLELQRRRPRWLGRLSLCLQKPCSQVQLSPTAVYMLVRSFSCMKIVWRIARERDLATFDENRRAVEMLNPTRDKNQGTLTGGGKGRYL